MSKVYITGHRNPDLDSLCAALSYARLKNLTDPDNEYIAVHCSPVSDSVRRQMEAMELEIPEYMKDVRPKVRDVMTKATNHLQASDPIFDLIREYSKKRPSVMPIYDGEAFKGLLSIDDIAGWFLNDNQEEIPEYEFSIDNVFKVIPARLIHRGKEDIIKGSFLVGAASFETFTAYIQDKSNSILVTGNRREHIEYAVKQQIPAVFITASDIEEDPGIDFSGYDGSVFITTVGTAETIRRVKMAEAVGLMMKRPTVTIDADELFQDGRFTFLNSLTRGLAVMDGGVFAGFVTRRCFLVPPSYKVILVDHNEPDQSIDGIETAEVIEIIDHHRLDSVSTKMPIFIDAEPLGSTCTIVYQQFLRHGIMPDQYTARILLTGIVADTLILRSPTTTVTDISTVEMLARLAKVTSIEEFGEKLFSITDNLELMDPKEMIYSDFKKYESGGVRMGIGQCEVTTLSNVGDYAGRYLEALEAVREKEGLDWTLLMITDVLREKSVLLATDCKENRDLPYKMSKKQIYSMPGVMSRKKQLLPTLISITAK